MVTDLSLAAHALAACAVAGALAAPARIAHADAPMPILSWVACGDDIATAEFAIARAPLDYDHPRGATTDLALARIPAANQANKIGTVFVNPGGPGLSGVDIILSGFGAELAQLLDGRFDVVGFDPRGVGASDPLHCFDSMAELIAFFGDAPKVPYRPDQLRPFFDLYRALAPKCLGQGSKSRAI